MASPDLHQELESRLESINRRMERAEPALEDKFRICLETLLDGFAILSSVRALSGEIEDFRFAYINAAGCRLNRHSREDTLGRRLLEILPKHLGDLFAAFQQVVDTGEPMAREILAYEDRLGTGRRVNQAFDLRAVKLGDGVAVTWRDTTEGCSDETATREQVALFRTIFEDSPEAILLTSAGGRILAANASACRLTGRSETEICALGGEGVADTADPQTQTYLSDRRRVGHARGTRGELTLKRGDGTRFPAEVSSTLFTDPTGRQLTVVLFRDLSRQKRLEARSRRLTALVESTDDAIYTADLNGTITDWNGGAAALYGYTAEEAIGSPPSLIVPERLLPDARELIRTLQEGRRFRNHETVRRRKDGTLIHVSLTASPILLPDGGLSGISVIARDITRQVEAAAEREHIIQKLQAALADVKTLSGLVPICSWCKRIRDDHGYWTQLDHYLQNHFQAQFTHGICPRCAARFHPDVPIQGSASEIDSPE